MILWRLQKKKKKETVKRSMLWPGNSRKDYEKWIDFKWIHIYNTFTNQNKELKVRFEKKT